MLESEVDCSDLMEPAEVLELEKLSCEDAKEKSDVVDRLDNGDNLNIFRTALFWTEGSSMSGKCRLRAMESFSSWGVQYSLMSFGEFPHVIWMGSPCWHCPSQTRQYCPASIVLLGVVEEAMRSCWEVS